MARVVVKLVKCLPSRMEDSEFDFWHSIITRWGSATWLSG